MPDRLYTYNRYRERYYEFLQAGYSHREAFWQVEQELRDNYPGMTAYTSFANFQRSMRRAQSSDRNILQISRNDTGLPPIYTLAGYMLRFYHYLPTCRNAKAAYIKVEDQLQEEYPGMSRYSSYAAFRNAKSQLSRLV